MKKSLLALILILLFVSNLFAASSRHTATNESISTYGNGTRNYTSLAAWEAATDVDLVGTTTSYVLECYDDADSFNDYVTLSEATTNSSYFRIIRPASGQGHDGTPNNGVYFLLTTDTSLFTINEPNSQIQDLIGTLNISSINTRHTFYAQADNNGGFIGCIVRDSINSGSGSAQGFTVSGNNTKLVNCLTNHSEAYNFYITNSISAGEHVYFYNCTTTDAAYGFRSSIVSGGTVHFKNCLSKCTIDFYNYAGAASFDVNYCASGDATADDWGGAGNRINQTFTFVNAGGDDYHLASNDAGARNYGTDLSADGVYAFDDDINDGTMGAAKAGQTRPGESVWDIGFDEYIATGVYEQALTLSLQCALGLANNADIRPSITFSSTSAIAMTPNTDTNPWIALPLSSSFSAAGSLDIQKGIELLNSVQFQGMKNVEIATSLALSLVASLYESNNISAQTALLLSNAVASTPVSQVDYETLLTLAIVSAYQSSAPTGGTSYDVYLTLSIVSSFIQDGKVDMNTALELPLSAVYAASSSSVMNAALALSNAISYLPANTVDWSTTLTLAKEISQQYGGRLDYYPELTLGVSTTMIPALTTVIQEGILTLSLQASFDAAAQLTAYTELIFKKMASIEMLPDRDIQVSLILDAISTFVMTGYTELLEILFGSEVPPRSFGSETLKRIFGTDAPARTFGREVPAK